MSEKVGPFGGNNGDAFDDGPFTYNAVKKVSIGENYTGVECIKIEYEKDGKTLTQVHGAVTGNLKEFGLNYPDEYITSIQGTCSFVTRYNTTIVKTLTFKTSHGRKSPIFGRPAFFSTAFVLEGKAGAKLTGFHGRSGAALDSIGAHFFTSYSPLKYLKPCGGTGYEWDDGAHDGVTKISVGLDCGIISYVKFEYVDGSTSVTHSHGKITREVKEFKVDFPNEYLSSVEGDYDICGEVSLLTFKLSNGKIFSVVGSESLSKFVLAVKDHMLVGFCGRNGELLKRLGALGAHFSPPGPRIPRPYPTQVPTPIPAPAAPVPAAPVPAPVPVAPVPAAPVPAPVPEPVPAKKLEAKGGNGGTAWDDGYYTDVRKIYVGQGDSGVSFVKFEYDNNKKLVEGDGHGKKTLLGTEEFELDFPSEYIVSVEGCYDKVYGIEAEVVTMLKFKTNKRTSQPFGLDGGTAFALEMKDYKIVGFHGKAGDFVHQVGVHVSPIAKP